MILQPFFRTCSRHLIFWGPVSFYFFGNVPWFLCGFPLGNTPTPEAVLLRDRWQKGVVFWSGSEHVTQAEPIRVCVWGTAVLRGVTPGLEGAGAEDEFLFWFCTRVARWTVANSFNLIKSVSSSLKWDTICSIIYHLCCWECEEIMNVQAFGEITEWI